jgi:hypothetical protein
MEEKFSNWTMNKTTAQNVWQHHFFLQPWAQSEVGEIVAHMWPQVVEIAAL